MAMIDTVRKTSLEEAKTNLSELVDQAEHHGRTVVILRHGKPAAALVPVAVVLPRPRRRKRLTFAEARRSVEAFVAEFSAADPDVSAVADLIANRR